MGSFFIASFLLLLSPGPSVLYVVSRTLEGGRKAAIASVAGLACGDVIQVIAVGLGISALITAYPVSLYIIQYCGALYLLFLAYKALPKFDDDGSATEKEKGAKRFYYDAVAVNALNPKTTLFFISFFPGFIDPLGASILLQFLALGFLFVIIGIGTNSLYAVLCLAGSLRFQLLRSRFMQNWLPSGI